MRMILPGLLVSGTHAIVGFLLLLVVVLLVVLVVMVFDGGGGGDGFESKVSCKVINC